MKTLIPQHWLTRSLCAIASAACACTLFACAPASDEQGSATDANAQQSFQNKETAAHAGETFFNGRFTFDELLESHKCQQAMGVNGEYGAGAYIVGADGAPTPGLYTTHGSQTETSSFFVYRPSSEEGKYELAYPYTYFGIAFADLKEGQVFIYEPAIEEDTWSAAPSWSVGTDVPLLSGTYRVGIDVPPGTYVATAEEQSASAIADLIGDMTPQVNVYPSLDFSSEEPLLKEGLPRFGTSDDAFTFTVENGQILELFGCTAKTI